MFVDKTGPRVFAQPPGSDFATEFADGLIERSRGLAPEVLARTEIYVNVRSLRSGLIDRFVARGDCLIPKIRLLSELSRYHGFPDLPEPTSRLGRCLALTRLVRPILETDSRFGPHSTLYSLASSLEQLLDELQCEGLDLTSITSLDMADLPEHWQNSFHLIRAVEQAWKGLSYAGSLGRMRLVVERFGDVWSQRPPEHPVIVAGSTGSVGATRRLMQIVANLPQGALVIPCLEQELPDRIWGMIRKETASDHPQHNIAVLLDSLDMSPDDVEVWHDGFTASRERNRLISMAMLPIEATSLWIEEGSSLGSLEKATAGMALVEAPTERLESIAIAICLREAHEAGKTAALVTPDKQLVRQVRSALKRWSIIPDDSFGKNLDMTTTGSFLMCIAEMMGSNLSAEQVIALLEHPLASNDDNRELHRSMTDQINLHLRRYKPGRNICEHLYSWAVRKKKDEEEADSNRTEWMIPWLELFEDMEAIEADDLVSLLDAHVKLAVTATKREHDDFLWNETDAGMQCKSLLTQLRREAADYGKVFPGDYAELFRGMLQTTRFYNREETHKGIMIWNTEDARMQRPDVIIAGRLNNGIWPAKLLPDMWLNRQLRSQIGLALPEHRIGLSAHDFQHVAAIGEVVLTRCMETTTEPTLPSRWLIRLVSLLEGLPHGKQSVAAMKERGRMLLQHAVRIDKSDEELPRAPRPVPCPPVHVRPNRMQVTRIPTLIINPYAIYARDILGLHVLESLRMRADPRTRGIAVHRIMELFVREYRENPEDSWALALQDTADTIFGKALAPEHVTMIWNSKFKRLIDRIIDFESSPDRTSSQVFPERECNYRLVEQDFTLVARVDRLEQVHEGQNRHRIFDYKTGPAPTVKNMESYDLQLPLLMKLTRLGAFTEGNECEVELGRFIEIGNRFDVSEKSDLIDSEEVWINFTGLIEHFRSPDSCYPAKRYRNKSHGSEYDHLARYEEWRHESSDTAGPIE